MSTYNLILVIATAVIIFMAYFILSIITASHTRKSQLSFIQLFLISFFLTPITGAALLITLKKRSYKTEYHYKCPSCGYYFTEVHSKCPQCITDGYTYRLSKVKKLLTA